MRLEINKYNSIIKELNWKLLHKQDKVNLVPYSRAHTKRLTNKLWVNFIRKKGSTRSAHLQVSSSDVIENNNILFQFLVASDTELKTLSLIPVT